MKTREEQLEIEERKAENGKEVYCDSCGSKMIFKRVFNIGWWCPVCN